MERASAQTMAEEMAARWWGKKDLGEALLSPYTCWRPFTLAHKRALTCVGKRGSYHTRPILATPLEVKIADYRE